MLSFVSFFQGSSTIQSRYVRTTDDSAESGCIPSRRRSCFSASFSTSGGIPAALIFSRSSSISSDLPSMSPSSVLMAFICSRRKYSRWLLVISSLAWLWIFACISASWSSRERRLLTMVRRATGSPSSSTPWASSSFSRRLLATRSARTPGLLMFSVTIRISTGMFLRERIFSIFSRQARMSASTSREPSRTLPSVSLSIRTRTEGFESMNSKTRPLTTPWIRILRRPSGSLSIRMIMATVPVRYRSSGFGSSSDGSLCVARKMYRSRPSASSTAAIDASRPTNRGSVMYGKMTISRTGRSGSTLGISGALSLVSLPSPSSMPAGASASGAPASPPGGTSIPIGSSAMPVLPPLPGMLFLRLDPDAFPLAAPLLALGDAEHQNAVLQHRPRQPHVQAAGQLETPAELPEGPLDAQEGGILPARIPHLLPEHLDRPPLHEDRDLVPPHAGKLQPDDQLLGVLVDVRGGQERRVPEQIEERHPPHALPEDDSLPLLPVLSFGRFAHLFLSLARKARRPGPNSGSFRANAMLAIRKPSLFPASYRTPSNSYPSIRSRATSDRSASVSWISPPAPGRVATRAGKMAGERM